MRAQLSAAAAYVRRDFQLAISYRLSFAGQYLSIFFSLSMFYFVSRLVHVSVFSSADAYYAFAVIGLVILQVLNSTFQTPSSSLRQELVAGTFERILVSPFGAVNSVIAMLIFPLLMALVSGLVMLVFTSLAYDVHVSWSTAPLAIPIGILGAASFAPFGILTMAIVMAAKQAAGFVTWIVAGIALVSGLYFPIALLPEWVRWAAYVQPFTPSVDLLRHVLVGTPLNAPAWVLVGRVAAFGAVLLPASFLLLRLALAFSHRRGTIVEY